jgi:hypothetical protein
MADKIITLWAADIAIHFLKRIRKNMHFFYLVEVENIGVDEVEYDIEKLSSPHGTNVLLIDNTYDYEIKEHKLLKQGKIKVNGNRNKGIIGFVKNERATNTPIINYLGYQVRLDFTERKK